MLFSYLYIIVYNRKAKFPHLFSTALDASNVTSTVTHQSRDADCAGSPFTLIIAIVTNNLSLIPR